MLTRTFCHLPGIGAKTEQRLWTGGARRWPDLASLGPDLLGPSKLAQAAVLMEESAERLQARDAEFFAAKLPGSESWRLLSHFHDSAAYVDIETTGRGRGMDHITAIALYDGQSVRTYVHGRDLEAFEDDIRDYKLLITFNGASFDVPILERELRIRLPRAHIDLRHALASIGMRGGLKRVEKAVGLDRCELDGLDGYFAVILWNEYENTGNPAALETLLAYNAADVLSLETLARHLFKAKVAQTPFADELVLPEPTGAANPHTPDTDLVRRLMARHPRYRASA